MSNPMLNIKPGDRVRRTLVGTVGNDLPSLVRPGDTGVVDNVNEKHVRVFWDNACCNIRYDVRSQYLEKIVPTPLQRLGIDLVDPYPALDMLHVVATSPDSAEKNRVLLRLHEQLLTFVQATLGPRDTVGPRG
jgi:hypothetical protein